MKKKKLKTKIKSHGDEVTDFYHKEIPQVDSNHTCLTVISLLLLLSSSVSKRVSIIRHIINDLETSSDDSGDSDVSDEE